MLVDHFPLLGLRLSTPRLELRLPSPEELAALAELAAEGVHAPEVMPFLVPWTDRPPAEVARSVIQHHWLQLGSWEPQEWSLNLTVFHAGAVVGMQTLSARNLTITREVATGSWLGRRHQGQGIGTEMRAAVLHLAFVGLDAEEATSAAFVDGHLLHVTAGDLLDVPCRSFPSGIGGDTSTCRHWERSWSRCERCAHRGAPAGAPRTAVRFPSRKPESTAKSAPVVLAERGDARSAITSATSCGRRGGRS